MTKFPVELAKLFPQLQEALRAANEGEARDRGTSDTDERFGMTYVPVIIDPNTSSSERSLPIPRLAIDPRRRTSSSRIRSPRGWPNTNRSPYPGRRRRLYRLPRPATRRVGDEAPARIAGDSSSRNMRRNRHQPAASAALPQRRREAAAGAPRRP